MKPVKKTFNVEVLQPTAMLFPKTQTLDSLVYTPAAVRVAGCKELVMRAAGLLSGFVGNGNTPAATLIESTWQAWRFEDTWTVDVPLSPLYDLDEVCRYLRTELGKEIGGDNSKGNYLLHQQDSEGLEVARQPYVDWDKAPEGCNAVFCKIARSITNGVPEIDALWEKWENKAIYHWRCGKWIYSSRIKCNSANDRIFKPGAELPNIDEV